MLKIGYIPFSKINIRYDKRNILLFSKLKKIKLVNYQEDNDVDVVVLPPSYDVSDLSIFKKKNLKVIYQLVDDYLTIDKFSFKNIFRGVLYYFFNKARKLTFNYKYQQEKVCQLSDAVICSSDEQYKKIKKLNKNCHILFEGNFHISKSKYKKKFNKKNIKLVWEGRAENISNLKHISKALIRLFDLYNIELHIITDIKYPYIYNYHLSTSPQIKKIFGKYFQENTTYVNSSVFFHQWNKDFVSSVIKNCDIAIIPLDTSVKMLYGKSMNKLILMWRNQIPTICSNIPSYYKISKEINLSFCCDNEHLWFKKIEQLIINNDYRESYKIKTKNFIEQNYSENKFIEQWDNVFASLHEH